MNTQMLLILSGVLQTLATVARSPSFGSSGYNYADLLELASRLVARGDEAIGELEELKEEVDQMLEKKQKPSASQIEKWKRRSDAAHAELQAMKARDAEALEDEDEEEDDDDDEDEKPAS